MAPQRVLRNALPLLAAQILKAARAVPQAMASRYDRPIDWSEAMGMKIDIAAIPTNLGTDYPPPFDAPCRPRIRKPLGDAAGLSQVGVNLLTLPPGAWSSQRHWHTEEDEFVYVLEGEVALVTDAGAALLRAGDAAGFKAGEPNGHHLQNRGDAIALVLEIGTRRKGDACHYPDIDLVAPAGGEPALYTRRDGTPYEDIKRRGPD
jgi:uncharacterized cupin superfamily protein